MGSVKVAMFVIFPVMLLTGCGAPKHYTIPTWLAEYPAEGVEYSNSDLVKMSEK